MLALLVAPWSAASARAASSAAGHRVFVYWDQNEEEDVETSGGALNNNGTYTGCSFGKQGNFFAVDIGTAQGQIPVPDNGRLIEWFAPDYTSYCILFGPTEGGVGPHHVDGTGGLKDPGILAADAHGNIYVPEAGAGRVLKFLHSSFPVAHPTAAPTGSPTRAPASRCSSTGARPINPSRSASRATRPATAGR